MRIALLIIAAALPLAVSAASLKVQKADGKWADYAAVEAQSPEALSKLKYSRYCAYTLKDGRTNLEPSASSKPVPACEKRGGREMTAEEKRAWFAKANNIEALVLSRIDRESSR